MRDMIVDIYAIRCRLLRVIGSEDNGSAAEVFLLRKMINVMTLAYGALQDPVILLNYQSKDFGQNAGICS